MDSTKINGDSWTGRDASRKASGGISQSWQRNGARLLIVTGGFGLFLLGYEAATYTRWTELVLPAYLAIQGVSLGAIYLRQASQGNR